MYMFCLNNGGKQINLTCFRQFLIVNTNNFVFLHVYGFIQLFIPSFEQLKKVNVKQ